MKITQLLIALAIFLSQYTYAQDFTQAFTTTWKTTTAGDSITIPTKGGSDVTDYDFWINWGDDTSPENVMGDDPNPSHTYDTAGTFTVEITGTFPHFYLNNKADIKDKLLSVEQWGNIAWESMANMFFGASKLTLNATDTPVLSGVMDMSFMFLFATAFNQDISGWNVSSVIDMEGMFLSATSFNQDIGNWNISNVTDMTSMFSRATAFNQNIGDWNVSGVRDMTSMFSGTTIFNQDIGDWNVSGVRDMAFMFSRATSFNQNIGGWNVSGVTDMSRMFSSATSFNQDIGGWNVSGVTDMSRMFSSATAFDQDMSNWNVSSVMNMESMFDGAIAFNQDIGDWNVDSVTNMRRMFARATAFNQDISGWNVSSVMDMRFIFGDSDLSIFHYEELLIAWNKLNLQQGIKLGAPKLRYRIRAQAAHDSLTSKTNHRWTINDMGLKAENDAPVVVGFSDIFLPQGFSSHKISINSLFTDPDGDPLTLSVTTSGMAIDTTFANNMLTLTEMGLGVKSIMMTATDGFGVQVADTFLVTVVSFDSAFMTTWKTTFANETITIPIKGGSDVTDYDFQIDWGEGDGKVENITGDNPNPTHTYATAGTFTVEITGTFPHFYLNDDEGIKAKLLSVEQWGNIAWESMANMFFGASKLTLNATDTPVLSGVTSMNSMFAGATSFNRDIGGWNVSNVRDMSSMFAGVTSFNGDIGGWNVSNVRDMSSMFSRAIAFNQDIRSWNVSSVEDMSYMFFSATAFNQDIGGWSVDSVTDMSYMFSRATVFNQDIGGWSVDSVTDMSYMFSRATAFDQNIGGWNVSKVTSMNSMFSGATAFNQDIGDWNVSMVGNMFAMFVRTAFNQDIGDWNVSNVGNMSYMFFSATSFNQDIEDWSVDSVTNMESMFWSASAFNQDIGGWNVSMVIDMDNMFRDATSFNQDIGDWNVSMVTDMTKMLDSSGLSTYHYEELLIAWNKLNLQEDVPLGATDKQYRIRAQTAHDSLMNIHNWMITDGGMKTQNDAPAVLGFSDIALSKGFTSRKIPIDSLFTDDPEGDTWELTFTTRGDMAIDVTFANDMLTLTEMGTGVDSIIITATDEFSAQAADTFLVTVNAPPRIANALADLTLEKGFATHEIDISNVFEDEQPLTILVKLAKEGVITAAISGNTLTLTEEGIGVDSIIITATDEFSAQAADTFLVTIQNNSPRIANALDDLTLEKGFATHKIDLSNAFEDEQPLTISLKVVMEGVIAAVISGDTLTLTEVDTGATHVIVTASDGVLQTTDTFLVTIQNDPPRIANDLADLTLEKGFATHEIDISKIFEDEQRLTISVKVATEGVITAVISGDTTFTLTEVDTGATHVIITASDGVLQTTDTFLVTIQNDPPRIANALADLTLEKGFATHEIDISNVFEDEQRLTISVKVAMEGVVAAMISGDTTLTLTEIDTGATHVIVTASDGDLQVMDTFLVTVEENVPPRIANALADLTLEKGFATHEIDISNVFEDEQRLTLSVKVAMEGVITAVINSDTLTLTEVDTGATHVIVTASDGVLQTTDTFLVTIQNDPPRIANALADLTLEKGFATHEIDLSKIFEDEQPLTISVKVATAGVLTAVISGNTLTLTEMGIGETNVMLIASDGALQTTETFLVTVSEATDLITAVEVEKELVKLYPNPTVGTVSLDLGSVEKALMRVYTLQGNIIFEKVLLENTYNIELPGSAGIYLVEIITTNNRQIIKLVKE